MRILDSNVWIYITTADDLPVEVYSETLGERLYFTEEFCEDRHETVLSAYMSKRFDRDCIGLHG